jgi:hypothetical protein
MYFLYQYLKDEIKEHEFRVVCREIKEGAKAAQTGTLEERLQATKRVQDALNRKVLNGQGTKES